MKLRSYAVVRAVTVVVALLGTVLVSQLTAASGGEPDGATTFRVMIGGVDFRARDSDNVIRFAENTGGGIWLQQARRSPVFLEAPVDLPNGAQITRVTFFIRNCETITLPASALYFGAYRPAAGAFDYAVPEFVPPRGACDATQAVARTLSPAVTVRATQRYVVGFRPAVTYLTDTYTPNGVNQVLVGAQVTYLR